MGVRLFVRTDLRNDKDKRSLRLCQEVNNESFFLKYQFSFVGYFNNQ
jgi:hypothetical protein